ncbi:MAG: hypothetical protein CR984_04040 [Proteobacteria bacterium]|nr:MAG: hypothetical protein CR984_04040 [Pseudomonadota bacterium]PIE67783.1 MAG: hypothetical protein CSA23_02275 [Deltaproteobacteria bacterium]
MTYTFKYRQLAEALYDSLTEDAFYIAMENSLAEKPSLRRETMLRYYDYSMREARNYGSLLTPDDESWGASICSMPLDEQQATQKDSQKKAFLTQHMGNTSMATYAEITAFMDRHTMPCVPAGSWYLSIIGVAPPHQGQGWRQRLIRPLLEQAAGDRSHSFVYLETFTHRNMGFYRRLGFQEKEAFDEPKTGSRYWVMIREPAA